MPQQPKDPRLLPDNEVVDSRLIPEDDWTWKESLKKGLIEGVPNLEMLPPERYPGATSNAPISFPTGRPGSGQVAKTTVGEVSRASMYPVGAFAENFNKIIKPLTSPQNVALMGLATVNPAIIPHIAAVYGSQMAMQVPEQIQDIGQSIKEKGAWDPETIGKYGELGLNLGFTGGMVGGAARFKKNQVNPRAKTFQQFSTEPGFGETPGGSWPPVRPPVSPSLAEAVKTNQKAPPDIITSIEDIHRLHGEGVIDRPTALDMLNKYYKNEQALARERAPVMEPSTALPPNNVNEVVDMMRTGKVKNVKQLQQELGISYNQTRVIWYKAKKIVEETATPEGFFDRMAPEGKSAIEQLNQARHPKPPDIPPAEVPVVPIEEQTFIIRQENANAGMVKEARDKGYEFVGLNDRGDFKFRKKPEATMSDLLSDEGQSVLSQREPLLPELYEGFKESDRLAEAERNRTEVLPSRSPIAKRWADIVDELDAEGAPDSAYRDILSTGSKDKLKKGETWRSRVQRYIESEDTRFAQRERPSMKGLLEEEGQSVKTAEGKGGMGIPEGGERDVIEVFRGTIAGETPQVAGKELLQNAIDATAGNPRGHVKISYNPGNAKTPNGYVRVTDNGPGITLDRIYTDYLDITGSGKRGGATKTIGELGVGKVAYLTKGESFTFRTVVRESDGLLYEHTFTATPEEVLTHKIDIKSRVVPEGTPTGVMTDLKTGPGHSWTKLDEYLKSLKKHSNLPVPIEVTQNWPNDYVSKYDATRKPEVPIDSYTVPPKSPQSGELIAEGTNIGGTWKMTIPDDAIRIGDSNQIEVVLVSRGMFQGSQTIYTNRKARIPDRIILEIEPTVKGTHEHYPLTTPTREAMKPSLRREITSVINEKIVEGAAKERAQEMERIFNQLVPKPGENFALVDSEGRFSPSEISMIAHNPELIEIAKISNGIVDTLMEIMADHLDSITPKVKRSHGYILDPNVRGMNVRNPNNHSEHSILLNPVSILESAKTPEQAADAIMHVTIHEFTHMISFEEGAGFTSALADVYTRFGARRQNAIVEKLTKILDTGFGQYSQQVQSILRTGKQAFGRKGGQKLALISEEGSQLPTTQGPQGTTPSGRNTGKRPIGSEPTIVIKSSEGTPANIKKLYDAGYRFLGENDKGNLRFKKTGEPGKAPILEEDVLPSETPEAKPPTEVSKVRQVYDLSRGLMSVDPPFMTSAAFRQAMPLAGTKNWFKAWAAGAKSFGSKEWYEARMKQIMDNPLFKKRYKADGTEVKSFAEEIGIRMTDLANARSSRAEGIKSQLAERIPVVGRYVASSNRAFSGFLNDLRANQLEAFVKDSKALSAAHKNPQLDITRNLPLARELAQFINDATGASTLKTGFGGHQYTLERHAQKLADVFFSPRLMASRIRMLNPSTYIMANPMVRKQYTLAMLRTVGMWWGMAQLGQLAGGTVVTDSNNPDFGKIKIGDTRIDPGAGFQQWLVLGSRIKPDWAHLPIDATETGITPIDLATGLLGTPGGKYSSSISGTSRNYGEGFNPPTRASAVVDFLAQKVHPTAKLFYDIAAADERKPVFLGDRIMQLYVPMMAGDIAELAATNPELIPLVIPFSGVGGGSQTYTGAARTPSFTPLLGLEEYDIQIGGKKR